MKFYKKIGFPLLILFFAVSVSSCARDSEADKAEKEKFEVLEEPKVSSAVDHQTDEEIDDEPVEDPSGIEWVSLKAAQEEALKTGKKVLIFGYADWCPYCKQMRRETYTNDKVREQLYEYFIPVELNAEVDDEIEFNGETFKSWEFAQAIQLFSYPMHFFVNPEGEFLGAQPGFLPADVFAPLLTFIGQDLVGQQDFEEYLKEQENVVIEP